MRKLIRSLLVVGIASAGMFAASRPAGADPSFGNDAAFPIVGILANNILEPVAGAPVVGPLLPPPAARITSLISPPNVPAFGEIEDISYGDATPLVGPVFVEFSVGPQFGGGLPTGHPGAPAPLVGVNLRQEAAIFPPPPFGDGSAMSDEVLDHAISLSTPDATLFTLLTVVVPLPLTLLQSPSPGGGTFLFSVTKGSDVSLWTFSLQDRKATPFGSVHSSTRSRPSM